MRGLLGFAIGRGASATYLINGIKRSASSSTGKPKRLLTFRRLIVGASIAGAAFVTARYVSRRSRLAKPDRENRKRLVILGSGWAAVSLLQNLDPGAYDVSVVSPRNYFLFTPLLPSVTVGTIEPRSIAEPIRALTTRTQGSERVKFHEAKGLAVDPNRKSLLCRDVSGITGENADFELDYDVLVMAVGSSTNTFNTPGVEENCFFVKELSDAARIRNAITDSIETACMPQQTEEERRRLLHFVVVGGGPTGVEFAAELHDFVEEDLSRLYPKRIVDDVQICLVQSADHILNTYDQNISDFTEKQFKRDGIHVITNCRVTNVDEREFVVYDKKTKQKQCLPYGLCVWATGISLQPIAVELSKELPEQTHRRALTTDGYLRVKGAESSIFAIGDCSSVEQKQMVKEVDCLFGEADVNGDGQVTVEEFRKLLSECRCRYPQIAAYFSQSWDENIEKLFEKADQDGSCNLDLNEFRLALKEVDRELKSLPATAQVASQQGEYLGHLLNNLAKSKDNTDIESLGLLPFKYKHSGSMAYVGANHAVLELPLVGTLCGWWVMWLWRGAYANQLSSTRTKTLVVLDWCKAAVFGRDTSRI